MMTFQVILSNMSLLFFNKYLDLEDAINEFCYITFALH